MKCPDCGKENRLNARYCEGCGARLPEQASDQLAEIRKSATKYCTSCGAEIRSGVSYCDSCGQAVTEGTPAHAHPSPTEAEDISPPKKDSGRRKPILIAGIVFICVVIAAATVVGGYLWWNKNRASPIPPAASQTPLNGQDAAASTDPQASSTSRPSSTPTCTPSPTPTTPVPPDPPQQPEPEPPACLDWDLDPNYETVTLESGFHALGIQSDPYSVDMIAGGPVDVGECDLGPDCRGYATRAPDLQLNWSGEPLRILFEANQAGGDAVLIVNDYTGHWLCNDDFTASNLNPLIDIPARTGGGVIDIWVANYSQSDFVNGVLYITEQEYDHSDLPLLPPPQPQTGLDYYLDPTYGTVTLPVSFWPDPHSVWVESGGPINVDALGLGPNCTGYTTREPDLRLNWSGSWLRILFKADQAMADTVLIVNDYTGNWICNDDFGGGYNPALDLPIHSGGGQINIWVASYVQNTNVEGKIYFTEGNLEHDDLP
ncbi:MAG: zinc-ribbon domain-containing protein [Anaerolineales bacterium]